MKRQIFAIGDNGFRSDPLNHSLYRHLLLATGKARPKVCVIPTASGDAQDYIDAFFAMFKNYDCEVSQVNLFRGDTEAIEERILAQDLIYVTGGNTRNMLVLWKEWGVAKMLRKAYRRGVVLAGGSAGMLCWFQGGVTDSIPGRFSSMTCLEFLKQSACPHYNELTRRPYYIEAIRTRELAPGYAAENGVAFHYCDEVLVEAISAYSGRRGFFVDLVEGVAIEKEITVRVLS